MFIATRPLSGRLAPQERNRLRPWNIAPLPGAFLMMAVGTINISSLAGRSHGIESPIRTQRFQSQPFAASSASSLFLPPPVTTLLNQLPRIRQIIPRPPPFGNHPQTYSTDQASPHRAGAFGDPLTSGAPSRGTDEQVLARVACPTLPDA